METFALIADVTSAQPVPIRAALSNLVEGTVTATSNGFHVEGHVAGDDPQEANRALFSTLRPYRATHDVAGTVDARGHRVPLRGLGGARYVQRRFELRSPQFTSAIVSSLVSLRSDRETSQFAKRVLQHVAQILGIVRGHPLLKGGLKDRDGNFGHQSRGRFTYPALA